MRRDALALGGAPELRQPDHAGRAVGREDVVQRRDGPAGGTGAGRVRDDDRDDGRGAAGGEGGGGGDGGPGEAGPADVARRARAARGRATTISVAASSA